MPSATGTGIKIKYGAGSSDFTYWNGLNSAGSAVSSGTYVIEVSQDSQGSAKNVFTASVAVLQLNISVFEAVLPSQNPVPAGVNQITFVLTGGAVFESHAGVYSLAGDLVGRMSGANTFTWNIPASMASRIYLVRVEASSCLGRHRAMVLKIAILR